MVVGLPRLPRLPELTHFLLTCFCPLNILIFPLFLNLLLFMSTMSTKSTKDTLAALSLHSRGCHVSCHGCQMVAFCGSGGRPEASCSPSRRAGCQIEVNQVATYGPRCQPDQEGHSRCHAHCAPYSSNLCLPTLPSFVVYRLYPLIFTSMISQISCSSFLVAGGPKAPARQPL